MEQQTRDMTVDPVCGEELGTGDIDYQVKYQGKTYFFCCLNCQLDFEEAPQNYLGPSHA